MKYRVTSHNGRIGLANHNDRTFDLSKAEHINIDQECINYYWTWNKGVLEGRTLDETFDFKQKIVLEKNSGNLGEDEVLHDFQNSEMSFYKKNFAKALKITNDKYKANYHPERCRTIEDWYTGKNTRPEESIYQIGNIDNFDGVADFLEGKEDYMSYNEVYEKIIIDLATFLRDWSKEHNKPYTILDVAIHFDESTPHAHVRKVWHYKDDMGVLRPGQDKALEKAGVKLFNPLKKRSRTNNRKMTFDAMVRNKFIEICKSYGIDIEAVPDPKNNRKNKEKEQYIADKLNQEIDDKSQEIFSLEDTISDLVFEEGQIDARLEEKKEQLKELDSDISKKILLKERIEVLEEKIKNLEKSLKSTEEEFNILWELRERVVRFVSAKFYDLPNKEISRDIYQKVGDWFNKYAPEISKYFNKRIDIELKMPASRKVEEVKKDIETLDVPLNQDFLKK